MPACPSTSSMRRFNADIGGGGFDTLGGFISSRLGRLPTVGDTVESSGLRIEVLSMTGRRLKRVLVRQVEPASGDSIPSSCLAVRLLMSTCS